MLMSSMWIGFIAALLTVVLLAADWYIWAPRYWDSERYEPDVDHPLITDGKQTLYLPGAAEGQFVATPGSERTDKRGVRSLPGGITPAATVGSPLGIGPRRVILSGRSDHTSAGGPCPAAGCRPVRAWISHTQLRAGTVDGAGRFARERGGGAPDRGRDGG